MRTEIKIQRGTQYLSEAISALPENCLFDKGKVGCGGSHIALVSNQNYIICVPFVSLIHNKVSQVEKYPNVFGVHEGVTHKDIVKYIESEGVKKIMVTFDSLERVMSYIKPDEYNILIDEYHLLFTQYSFRREAAQRVLSNYNKFKAYTFMTATVVDDEFILDELKDIDVVVAVWEDTQEVTVKSIQCVKSPVDATVVSLIDRFLGNKIEGNAYLFVNSVEFIKDIVTKCKLTEDNCRVIYSKNNKTQVGLPNSTTLDAPKKINFLTSTVFEGSDIFDVDGKIYIISDSRKLHTLTDISTSFQQIAGRIRNTKYFETITHIFTTTRYYNNLSYTEFKNTAFKQIQEAHNLVEEYNNLSALARNSIKAVAMESYVVKYDDMFSFDPNLVKIDLYNFKICKSIYKLRVNVVGELVAKGFTVSDYKSSITEDVIRVDTEAKTFKEFVEEIRELSPSDELYVAAITKYPFLKDAIQKIGFDGIEELGYVVTNVKRALIKLVDSSKETKVMLNLKLTGEFSNGVFISAKRAKEVINRYYVEYDIKRTADIKDFFEVKESSKWINNKTVRGYIVIMPRIIINN